MFLSSILDKSVFTKQSISKAIGKDGTGGYAIVKIEPKLSPFDRKDDIIIGVMQDNPMNFSMEATWSEGGGAAALTNIPLLNSLIDAGGITDALVDMGNKAINPAGISFGRAIASRKIYQQSGYLKISPKIRIVDWNGDGQPIKAASLLATYCLPTEARISEEAKAAIKKMMDEAKDIGEPFVKFLKDVTEGVRKSPTGQATIETLKAYRKIAEAQADGMDDLFTLRASPSPVILTIGEYFQHDDMVIENVQFNFSKEVTAQGPLFLDAEIQLSSRFIINDISKLGLKNTGYKRVSYASQNGISTQSFTG
jgi:hypothetical protein